jgi:hypothetical protein
VFLLATWPAALGLGAAYGPAAFCSDPGVHQFMHESS